jgi:hypothetical protein
LSSGGWLLQWNANCLSERSSAGITGQSRRWAWGRGTSLGKGQR